MSRERGMDEPHGDSFRLSISSSSVKQVALSHEFTVPRNVQVITGQQREGFLCDRKE